MPGNRLKICDTAWQVQSHLHEDFRSERARFSVDYTTSTLGIHWRLRRVAEKTDHLILSPLDWQMADAPVANPEIPCLPSRPSTAEHS